MLTPENTTNLLADLSDMSERQIVKGMEWLELENANENLRNVGAWIERPVVSHEDVALVPMSAYRCIQKLAIIGLSTLLDRYYADRPNVSQE